MTSLRIAVIAAATAIATILLGWWSVALLGLGAGLVRSDRRAPVEAGAGGALGWAGILVASAVSGPVWTVAQRVGPVFQLPAAGLVLVTLVWPFLVAASGAWLSQGIAQWARETD